MEAKELENAWKLIATENPENIELARQLIIGGYGDFDEGICAVMNHMWNVGDWATKKALEKVQSGGKPEGWHWGRVDKGRGMAEFIGTIVTYNVYGFYQSMPDVKPDFRHLSQSKLAPLLKNVLDTIERARGEIKKAAFNFCKAVGVNDPHEIAAALVLYDRARVSELNYGLVPENYFIQQSLMYDGPLATPPFSKGQYVEAMEEIYIVERVFLRRSGINMEWHIDTCSLKKDGTANGGNQAKSVHISNIPYLVATNIEDWEWLGKDDGWVKKQSETQE